MSDQASARKAARFAQRWVCAIAALSAAMAGCVGPSGAPRAESIDRVSRSSESFSAFLQSPGKTIDEIRELMPDAKVDSVYLIDENVTNEKLGEFIQQEASGYSFEIFLRVTVSTENKRIYRYVVKGDWRSVKMGYGSLLHPELYDAIYLHTHPQGKRIIPNSISDYIHAETFKIVSTLLVGNGIAIEFESIEQSEDRVDHFDVDGRNFSLKRPERERIRSRNQLRRRPRDANASVRELNRVFTENVESGHERVALRNSEGMLVTYERNRGLKQRLNEVYREAGLVLPMGSDGIASSIGLSHTSPADTPRPLGY